MIDKQFIYLRLESAHNNAAVLLMRRTQATAIIALLTEALTKAA